MTRFGSFFLPGPTEVRASTLRAMTRPMIGHRGPEFEELFARLQTGLRAIFRTTRPVFVSTSSATGLMEAGIRSAPRGPVLALVNGSFSERFAKIAERCGRECDRYFVPAGMGHEPDELESFLARRRYATLTVVHSETSTGVLNDVRRLTEVAHEHGIPALIDSVSGVGGVPLEFDAWKLDFVLTGSQKALALPPGLAFATASPAFVAGAASVPDRGLYFDLLEFEEFAAKNQTPNTPAIPLLFALDEQLGTILHEGIERRWARHAAMRDCVDEWVTSLHDRKEVAIELPVSRGKRSPTVSAIRLPEEIPAAAFVLAVAERGYTIGAGYRELGGSTVRVGHMGEHTVKTLSKCLQACEAAVLDLSGR